MGKYQCTAERRRPASPWGYHGTRFRCLNPATRRASIYSAGGARIGRFVVCDDHQPAGRLGVNTPAGYRWDFEDLT